MILLNTTNTVQQKKGAETIEATRKLLLNPQSESYEHLDENSRELVRKTIDFFEKKGKAKLKEGHNDNGSSWCKRKFGPTN